MHQDDEYGKNVLTASRSRSADEADACVVTSYKRGASDFSAQIAKMKSDGWIWSCSARSLRNHRRDGRGQEAQLDVTFLGATPTNVLEVPALGKDAVEGLYVASGSKSRTKTPERAR